MTDDITGQPGERLNPEQEWRMRARVGLHSYDPLGDLGNCFAELDSVRADLEQQQGLTALCQLAFEQMTQERDAAWEAIRTANVKWEKTERDFYLDLDAARAQVGRLQLQLETEKGGPLMEQLALQSAQIAVLRQRMEDIASMGRLNPLEYMNNAMFHAVVYVAMRGLESTPESASTELAALRAVAEAARWQVKNWTTYGPSERVLAALASLDRVKEAG